MRGLPARRLVLPVSLCLLFTSNSGARTEARLVGGEIPRLFYVGSHHIFYGSDSLYLNGRLLERDKDYFFDNRRSSFDLSRLNPGQSDTLSIVYSKIPSWVALSYGRSLPEVSPTKAGQPNTLPFDDGRAKILSRGDITISGTKTFRFSTRPAGSSTFGQSLDLRISGQLTPELEISGVVSDRGFNPSYGTANSRLNELDKINLKLTSKTFTGQIGDVVMDSRSGFAPANAKKVSGASVDVARRSWSFQAVAARPKGRFESFRFYGCDGMQGPYQVGEGSRALPIVPGSETVWLDGKRLLRGANKDYTIDYPTGRITFNANHPVDNRSRIEVDYEPQAADYKGELFGAGGGVSLGDSALGVRVRWLREGDDQRQPLAGELSAADLQTLWAVGDEISGAIRSSVRADSLGDYALVSDSLPDTVYRYMGRGNGEYSVTFAFFGKGNGDYAFLGGDNYQYVGPGNGDYRPVIRVPAPQRIDHYMSDIRIENGTLGEITAEFCQTRFDKNLLSDLDDDDNSGVYYSLRSTKKWGVGENRDYVTVSTRRKEADFTARERLRQPDFARTYLVPRNFAASSDETIHELRGSFSLSRRLTVSPFYSKLDYRHSFESRTGGLNVDLRPNDRYRILAGWKAIRADLDSIASRDNGTARAFNGSVSYRPDRQTQLTGRYEYDSRQNDYAGDRRGTRYHRYRATISGEYERAEYEHYAEDSLSSLWEPQLTRDRLSVSSSRGFGHFSFDGLVTYQWLRRPDYDESNLLSRTNLQYNSISEKLGFGATYVISEETRNSRGIGYIEVEQGEGDYILDDSNFIPDRDGNYILVEEILSDRARVRRGEKSFRFSKSWSKVLLRFHSNIKEELLPQGKRELWWAIPFLSDRRQPYLFYARRYDADVRVFPLTAGHAINLTFNTDREVRRVAGWNRERYDRKGAVAFKQVVGCAFLEEQVELFDHDRDSYYSGGGIISGYRVSLELGRRFASNRLSATANYRRARSELDERSEMCGVIIASRFQVVKKGELRSSLELYYQSLDGTVGNPSFLLTDNRPGERGAIWSISMRYGLRSGMRMNFSVSGRHSDDRSARVTGRGELIAGF